MKFPIFRQKMNFQIFGLTPPYSGHIWVARAILSDGNSIYGSYGPHTYGGILYMGHTGPIFPEKVLIYETSANPILEKVLIWSLLDLIWASLGLLWTLLSSIWSLLGFIWPYWALFGLDS